MIEPPHARDLSRDEFIERCRLFGLTVPALALIAAVMLLPIIWLFGLSFVGADDNLSLEHYKRLYERTFYLRIFYNTFELSVIVTAICLILGYPFTYFLSQLPRGLANMCLIAVILPLWTSVLVRTYAWIVLLQQNGLINNWMLQLGIVNSPLQLVHNFTGTTIGMVHIMLPFLILPLYASLRSIDRNYIKAAASLGATPSQAFWQIFFPLSLPGLIAGTLLVFVLCLGFYVTPALLGGGRVVTLSTQIQTNVVQYPVWGASSSLGVVLLFLTFLFLWIAFIATKFLRWK